MFNMIKDRNIIISGRKRDVSRGHMHKHRGIAIKEIQGFLNFWGSTDFWSHFYAYLDYFNNWDKDIGHWQELTNTVSDPPMTLIPRPSLPLRISIALLFPETMAHVIGSSRLAEGWRRGDDELVDVSARESASSSARPFQLTLTPPSGEVVISMS